MSNHINVKTLIKTDHDTVGSGYDPIERTPICCYPVKDRSKLNYQSKQDDLMQIDNLGTNMVNESEK